MDMNQMVYAHPETWLNAHRRRRRQRRHLEPLDADPRSGRVREAGAARHGVDAARRPGREPDRRQGRRLRRRQDRQLRRADRRQAVQLHDADASRAATPGRSRRAAKPVNDYKLVGSVVAADRHPGQGDAARTPTCTTSAFPGWSTPASCVRAAQVRNTSQNHFPLSVDETSIKHIPGAQVVQINNFLAVVAPKEYDAIQAAAQLKVVWKSDPKLGAGSGNFWTWLRKAGDTNTDEPGPLHDGHGQRRRRAGVGGEDGLGDLQVPVQRPHADRPARARSPTSARTARRSS